MTKPYYAVLLKHGRRVRLVPMAQGRALRFVAEGSCTPRAGETCTIRAVGVNEAGAIGWMNDWSEVDSFVVPGGLQREHYGPGTFGHVQYRPTTKEATP